MIRLLSKAGQLVAWAVILAAIWVLVASVVFIWIDNEPMDLSSIQLAYAWVINAPRFLNEFFATVYLGAAAIAGTAAVAGVAAWSLGIIGPKPKRRPLYGETHPASHTEMQQGGLKLRRKL